MKDSKTLIAYSRRLWDRSWGFRHRWFCRILHWRHRKPTFGGYGFGGRTNRQTAIHCSKCHSSYAVRGWHKAVVVKSDSKIQKEIQEFGQEQLTPAKYWRKGKWNPPQLTAR